jgi:hypothetical protein
MDLLIYDGPWLVQEKGKEDKNSEKSATTNSNVSSKRRGSGRIATNLMENINLLLP